MEYISIAQLRELIRLRLANPQNYKDKTLVLWDEDYTTDGILYQVCEEECKAYNLSHPKEAGVGIRISDMSFATDDYTDPEWICYPTEDGMPGQVFKGILFSTGCCLPGDKDELEDFVNTRVNRRGPVADSWAMVVCAQPKLGFTPEMFGPTCEIYLLDPDLDEWGDYMLARYGEAVCKPAIEYIREHGFGMSRYHWENAIKQLRIEMAYTKLTNLADMPKDEFDLAVHGIAYIDREVMDDFYAFAHVSPVKYTLSDDGVLTLHGNGWFRGRVLAKEVNDDEDLPPCFESEFRGMDFHTLVMEDGIVSIGESAFEGCTSLRKAGLPPSLRAIGAGAFRGCASLESVECRSDRLVYMGFDAFKDTAVALREEDGLLFFGVADNPRYVFMGCKKGYEPEVLTLPEGVVLIASGVCPGMASLREVRFPSTLRGIGVTVFEGAALTSLYLPDGFADEEGLLRGFDWCETITDISAPYELLEHKRKNDEEDGYYCEWYDVPGLTVTFRNPDGTVAEVYSTPKRNPLPDTEPSSTPSDGDDLPF